MVREEKSSRIQRARAYVGEQKKKSEFRVIKRSEGVRCGESVGHGVLMLIPRRFCFGFLLAHARGGRGGAFGSHQRGEFSSLSSGCVATVTTKTDPSGAGTKTVRETVREDDPALASWEP